MHTSLCMRQNPYVGTTNPLFLRGGSSGTPTIPHVLSGSGRMKRECPKLCLNTAFPYHVRGLVASGSFAVFHLFDD